jgi:predicted Zn finger-like uncharacterized protein
MIVTCASCLTKFNLDDSRISPKGIKVRCSRCKHVFYVVAPPETKEEVMEDFESFAKYHEDLMVPGEEPRKGPKIEEKGKEPPPPQKSEEETVPEPVAREGAAPEKEEEEAFPFREEAPKKTEEKEEEIPPGRVERAEIEPVRLKESPRRARRGPSSLLAVMIVLVLLIFGLFYVWTEMKSGGKLSPYLSIPIQKIEGFWNNLWGTEKEGLEVGELTGYEEKIGDMPLFVIGGKVSNQSRYTKKQIKVKVVIFDQDKIKIAEKEAVCGRVLSREELRSQPPAFFKGEMVIRQTEKEMIVPSGKAAPFMVVLRDPINQAKEFKVEIVEAPNL